ncbi:STAS domain-containing protein [Streptomyces sp. NBC_00207]|uniref:STAS domain-containing protein n=1 Tax=unclassified Streptomyces TaxID=2593676 RepID=UPI0028868E22|nr:STAS domain-containing protein [Streptomyces sp. DSM 41633]
MDADAQPPVHPQPAVVVVAQGDMDLDTSAPLAESLLAAAHAHPVVVLDTSSVTFADSAFLNLLLQAHALAELRIAALPHQLQRLLEMTGADAVLHVHPTVQAPPAPRPCRTARPADGRRLHRTRLPPQDLTRSGADGCRAQTGPRLGAWPPS